MHRSIPLLLLPVVVAVGCVSEPPVELAVLMGELQRHTDKLGYSIAAHNEPLAEFYLHELEETVGALSAIDEHDGLTIGPTVLDVLEPARVSLEHEMDGTSGWEARWAAYETLVDACNRCHTATEHAFIRILPVRGTPPYAQEFAPAP